MATQKEVAKRAGVSFITVSRVVNKEGNVKESTRLKVEAAISELGYFPSFAGKALNSGRNDTIGVMTPARFGVGMENIYLMGVLQGIGIACREKSQDILISSMSEDDPHFDYLRPYRQRKVDGMIYVGLKSMQPEMIREIEELRIPCVVIGDRTKHERISWVDTDNEGAGYETTKRIWALGHRQIAFHGIIPEIYNENIADRERGFRRAIRELTGAEVDEGMIVRGDYDRKRNREGIVAAFKAMKKLPSAIFCSTDNRALAALEAARELGLSVPGDLSIVGFDGFLKDNPLSPTVASNEQPLAEMGRRAAEILLERIGKRELPKREDVFTVNFIEGESLAPAGKKC